MNRKLNIYKLVAPILASLLVFMWVPVAQAASLTALSDTMSRLKNSTGATVYSNHTIELTLGGSTVLNPSETIIVDFDNDFGVTGFAASEVEDFDITVGGAEELIVANGACASNDAIEITTIDGTEKTFTFTACSSYTAGAAGAAVVIEIGTNATSPSTGDDQISNPTASQTALVGLTAAGDTGTLAVVIINDDQVVLTASVDPSITFSVSANASAFGVLAAGILDTAGTNVTLTVGTNGGGGYTITVRDVGSGTNSGLYNAGVASIIGSADGAYGDTADLSSAPLGYGLQISCTAGCTTGTDVNTRWRQGADVVGGLEITDTEVVTYGAATTSDHTLSVVHKAKSSASTKAGTYTDTLTYIATATF
jgi:hypothetical protein